MDIGSNIKKMRKDLDLTQAQLAENICAQTMISKIENNEITPNNRILEKLSKKLNVDLIDLIDREKEKNADEKTKNLKDMIDISLIKRDYEMINLIIQSNIETIEENNSPYFRWIRGLLYYYKEDNPKKAIQEFNKLDTTDLSADFTVDVLCSIGIVYYETENLEKACKYFDMGLNWFSNKIETRSKVKLLLNYSLCLESLDKDKKALDLIFQGIELSKKNSSIFGLGDLYYHKGYMMNKLKQYEEAIKSYKIANSLFEIQENSRFSVMANLRLEEILKNKETVKDEKDYA
ncbi:Tetratricopeptide repeat-containing protein [Alkalibacterium putridalgicola]|uniref:Tetratricopeptide repeat-containing protein n=1 Tax=Alkalibacterium putridalgicola TaxID=426703 RepID=A0A1H7X2E5_9LACT|nr:helix-turn-helix domain-containing protein [Alkalibacterium putridalgicola]GEK90225.1 transcriptional regulator [Alkalibacterium putridalgicola]SEM28066.1 Tetratricopeptide repeat-containing protein [Alkalibacterium putridalgicola]